MPCKFMLPNIDPKCTILFTYNYNAQPHSNETNCLSLPISASRKNTHTYASPYFSLRLPLVTTCISSQKILFSLFYSFQSLTPQSFFIASPTQPPFSSHINSPPPSLSLHTTQPLGISPHISSISLFTLISFHNACSHLQNYSTKLPPFSTHLSTIQITFILPMYTSSQCNFTHKSCYKSTMSHLHGLVHFRRTSPTITLGNSYSSSTKLLHVAL